MGDYLIYLVMSFIYVMKDIILLITFLVENFSNTLQLFPVVFNFLIKTSAISAGLGCSAISAAT